MIELIIRNHSYVRLNEFKNTLHRLYFNTYFFLNLNKTIKIFTYIIIPFLSLFLKEEKNGCSNFKIIPRIVRKSSYSLA